MKNFGIIGVAGYVAPKHLKAIKDTNNNLIAALDINDSVGILDSFFPTADFFSETERFDRHLEKLKYENNINLDYLSICTPNYLHDSHIRMALRRESNAICEKPLVLNPWNLDALLNLQKRTGFRIYNILQLREHPSILKLKDKIDNSSLSKKYDIDLTYITSRGNWYYTSWKGNDSKSGGIATNIGIHFFDMLSWIFGKMENNVVHLAKHDRASGYLEFKNARVRWFLSINEDLIPREQKLLGKRTYRSIKIGGEELEFSDGFNDLHTAVYNKIINNDDYGIENAVESVRVIHEIRNLEPIGLIGDYHPFCKEKLSVHPFKKIVK